MTKNKVFILIFSVLLLAPTSTLAQTVNHENRDIIHALQDQLDTLSRQVETLAEQIKQQSQTINEQQATIEKQARILEKRQLTGNSTAYAPSFEKSEKEELAKITMAPSPKIESAEKPYSFQPFGRVHLDSTHFYDDRKDHPSNTNFRRARLGVKGTLAEDISYKAEFDFAKEDIAFKDVSLTYTGYENTDLKIGHFKPALGLDNNTSSNYIPFIERSSVNNAFARGEVIGGGFFTHGSQWSLAGGIFGEDAGSTSTSDDESISADLRGAYSIQKAEGPLFHFGLGGSWRNPADTVKYSAKPTGIGDNMVDTGNIAAINDIRIGAIEAAAVMGPFSFQGEYFYTYIDRDSAKNAAFDGYYFQGGYFLTGETRPYSAQSGNFGRLKPIRPFNPKTGGWGAFEMLARYEALDLNDSDAGITGGIMDNYTVGLNWYLTNHIRIMGNLIMVDTGRDAVTANDDPTILNIRTQWDF